MIKIKIKIIRRSVFEIRVFKVTIRGILAGHTVPMVIYSFFETTIVGSTDKEW